MNRHSKKTPPIAQDSPARPTASPAGEASLGRFESHGVILDHLLEGFQVIDFDWRYVYVNEAVARQARRTRDELRQHTMMEVFPGIERTELFGVLARCMQERTPHQMENEFAYPDGTSGWFELRIEPVPEGIFILSLDITERKRAQHALQQSEERFRLLVENADEVFYQVSSGADPLRGRVVLVSPQVKILTGYDPQEFLDTPELWAQLVHPDDLPRVLESTQRILSSRTPGIREYRLRSARDGEYRWVADRVTLRFDGQSTPIGYQGVARDITDHKQAEDALRRSELQFERLFNSSPDGIVILSADGKILLANQQMETLFGYDAGELADLHVEDLIPARFKGHRALRQSYMTDSRARSMGLGLELFARRQDGSEFPVEIALSPLQAGAGAAVMATIRDMSERQRAAAERERILAALNIAQDGIFIFAPDTLRFFYVNAGAVRQTGYSQDELLSMTPLDIKAGFDEAGFRVLLEPLLNGEQPAHTYETIHRRKDGTDCPVEITMHSTSLAGGQNALVALVRDITQRRQLEAQLRQAQRMESVGRLAGGVAHDFNNLLTVINSTAELAAMQLREDDPLYQDLAEIRGAGTRAAVLTRQLLAFSRKQILQPEVLNLNTVLVAIRSMLGRLIGEDIDLVCTLAEHLGAVRVDPGQIEQVVLNLAVNARDAMPDGGSLTIETRNVELDEAHSALYPSLQPGRHVMLAISDSGMGMDDATRERIFEPFFTTKAVGKGTGLGLSTVYGIVEQSGGSIWVYSEVGKGTSFKIFLPRVEETADASRPAGAAAAARGTETVLVVEDESALRHVAQRILESAGYTVLVAANGGEALLLAERHDGPVDLILTDVVMPGMNGRELAARLAAIRPRMKVLYTSGYTDDAIVQHGVLDPEMRFISKPYKIEELARKIRDVLDS